MTTAQRISRNVSRVLCKGIHLFCFVAVRGIFVTRLTPAGLTHTGQRFIEDNFNTYPFRFQAFISFQTLFSFFFFCLSFSGGGRGMGGTLQEKSLPFKGQI